MYDDGVSSSVKKNQKTNKVGKCVLAIFAVFAMGGVSAYAIISSFPVDDGVDSRAVANNAYVSIPDNDIWRLESVADILWEPSNYSVVVIVHIDSIEGGRTYSPIFNQYISPQTYGKMTVREVYRGDVKTGEQLNYSRTGGIVPYDEYWKSLNEQQQEKIIYLNNGKKPNDKEYIKVRFSDDIDIEVEKDYLVFLIAQTSKDGSCREYLIDGMQFGLREVKWAGDVVTVLNNETREWESVDSAVK